jgi:hypothetical protein
MIFNKLSPHYINNTVHSITQNLKKLILSSSFMEQSVNEIIM